jgi:hypothetical protein
VPAHWQAASFLSSKSTSCVPPWRRTPGSFLQALHAANICEKSRQKCRQNPARAIWCRRTSIPHHQARGGGATTSQPAPDWQEGERERRSLWPRTMMLFGTHPQPPIISCRFWWHIIPHLHLVGVGRRHAAPLPSRPPDPAQANHEGENPLFSTRHGPSKLYRIVIYGLWYKL